MTKFRKGDDPKGKIEYFEVRVEDAGNDLLEGEKLDHHDPDDGGAHEADGSSPTDAEGG
jgi:hypothetical protein